MGCLKEVDLMVGLLTYAIGVFVMDFEEVTFSIFLSVGPTSSFLLGDSSIVIGAFVRV